MSWLPPPVPKLQKLPNIHIKVQLAHASTETQDTIKKLPRMSIYDQNIQLITLFDVARPSTDHIITLQSTYGILSTASFSGYTTPDLGTGIHFAACNVAGEALSAGNFTESQNFYALAYAYRPRNAGTRHPFMEQPYNALLDTVLAIDTYTDIVQTMSQYGLDGKTLAGADNPSTKDIQSALDRAKLISAASQRASKVGARAWAKWARAVNTWALNMQRFATAILLHMSYPPNGTCAQKAHMMAEVLDLMEPLKDSNLYVCIHRQFQSYKNQIGSQYVLTARKTITSPLTYASPLPKPTTVRDVLPRR